MHKRTEQEGELWMTYTEMLSPDNAALILIDYQPAMFQGV